MPLKFRLVWQVLGLDELTTMRLWTAVGRSGHPLGKRLYWLFVKEERRAARGIADRLGALLVAQPLHAWSRLLDHLVATERLTRPEANAVLECFLPLVDDQGQWR